MKDCKKQGCNRESICKESLNHLSRIGGQLRTLKKYIEEGRQCEDVAILTTSIAKSFDTLRAKTLKSFFLNEILSDKKLSKKELLRMEKMFKLYKK